MDRRNLEVNCQFCSKFLVESEREGATCEPCVRLRERIEWDYVAVEAILRKVMADREADESFSWLMRVEELRENAEVAEGL